MHACIVLGSALWLDPPGPLPPLSQHLLVGARLAGAARKEKSNKFCRFSKILADFRLTLKINSLHAPSCGLVLAKKVLREKDFASKIGAHLKIALR